MNQHLYHRRGFLGSAAFATALFTFRGAFADELTRTPPQTEGPFYPNKLPLDTDNDLIIVNDGITPAVGEITHLTGRILDASGSPVKNALVEIWQCDGKGVYLHTGDSGKKQDQQDKNFQGSAASSRLPPANTISGRSSRSSTRAGPRRTSISRSRRAARNCSARSVTSRATPATKGTASTAAFAAKRPAPPWMSTSTRSRGPRSASWPRSGTSSWALRRQTRNPAVGHTK